MAVNRFDAGRQPAGRAPAPGRLGLVQAFLNTFWDLEGGGAEVWQAPPAYAAWLAERGFAASARGAGGRPAHAVTEGDLGRAIEVREALRALALANHDDAPAPAAEAVLDRVAADGPDAALGLVLGVVFAARVDGSWRRMKACPHAHCGWVFYDRSRNRSSQWCSMRICGNRTKAARHRTRAAR